MHSTLTALIDMTDNSCLNIDDGLTNAILFIGLKKSVDTISIDHEISFRCWVSIFYINPDSAVLNNGFSTN